MVRPELSLLSNKKLTSLKIQYNNIHDKAALAIAEQKTTLEILDASFNHISPIGIAALTNTHIHQLNVEGNVPNMNSKLAVSEQLPANYSFYLAVMKDYCKNSSAKICR